MSICDRIVVMKDGILQQIGKPQEVYDDPVNLFVATFLGTPPINVFDARVEGGKLWIGKEAVMDTTAPEGKVTAAIRPEGFDPDPEGSFTCGLNRVEVMGRDITVVATHPDCENTAIRAIIPAENAVDAASPTVSFALKPNKVFLFSRETEARLL